MNSQFLTYSINSKHRRSHILLMLSYLRATLFQEVSFQGLCPFSDPNQQEKFMTNHINNNMSKYNVTK